MIRTHAFAIISALILLLSSMPLVAQEQPSGQWVFKADGGALHQSEVDLTDTGGGFSMDRWFLSAGFDYAWSQRDSIGVSIGGGNSNYAFTEDVGIGDAGAWNKITDSRVSLTWRFGFGETGSMILVPSVRFNGESGSDSGDGTTYGIYAATAWRVSEDLTIGPGIGVFTRMEDGARVFPLLAIDWDMSDRWNLSTGRGLAASQGPGLTLSYELNDDWSFGLGGRYEDVEFRLDNKGIAAGGVGRDQSIPLVFMAFLEPDPKFSLSVFAGVEIGGKLKLKNASGDLIDESSYDPAPIVGATFELRF